MDDLREAENEITPDNKDAIKEIIQKTIAVLNLVDFIYRKENEEFANLELVSELTQLIDFLQDFCLNPIKNGELDDAESGILTIQKLKK